MRVEDRAERLAKADKIAAVKLPKWATALDVFAVVMALIALSVVIGGGFRIWVFDSRLSVTGWWRPALWSVGRAGASSRADPASSRCRSASLPASIGVVAIGRSPHRAADSPRVALRRAAGRLSRRAADRVSARSDEPLADLHQRSARSSRAMGHRLVPDDRDRGLSVLCRRARTIFSRTSRSFRRSRCRCAICRRCSAASRCGPASASRSCRSTSR